MCESESSATAAVLKKCMVSNWNKNVWTYRKYNEKFVREEQVKCETFMPNVWSLAGLQIIHGIN